MIELRVAKGNNRFNTGRFLLLQCIDKILVEVLDGMVVVGSTEL